MKRPWFLSFSFIILGVGCGGGGVTGAHDQWGGEEVLDGESYPDIVRDEGQGAEDLSAEPEGLEDVALEADPTKADGEGYEVDVGEEVFAHCPGGPGCPCSSNSECYNEMCIETMEESLCATACLDDESCPKGFRCAQAVSAPDPIWVCMAPYNLCRPCKTDADCAMPGFPETRCLKYGPEGSFCGVGCDEAHPCPEGFECVEGASGREGHGQCMPSGGQPCPCTKKFKEKGFLTVCYKVNEFGQCPGERTCDSDCSAPEPGPEVCDGKDNDCDGMTDDEVPSEACDLTNAYGTCKGTTICIGGKVFCQGQYASPEICNGIDDDCDGETDEEGAVGCKEYMRDEDLDQYGVTSDVLCLCKPSAPYTAKVSGDCDDSDPFVHPGMAEKCDGKDNDCNGVVDDEGTSGCTTFFADFDGDGYGDPLKAMCLCGPLAPYTALSSGDCDDEDALVNPAIPEACNGKDDNCDGTIDGEGASGCKNYYFDGDGDGFGLGSDLKCLCGPEGQYRALQFGDCDDGDENTYPGALEICDERDNDCDGETDEGVASGCTIFYRDEDGDGFGRDDDMVCRCFIEAPYSAIKAGDCDDLDPSVHPGAAESCNGKDDDCNGMSDDGVASHPCDLVNEFGTCKGSSSCEDGKEVCEGTYAEAEVCDGKDNDCDGQVDEDASDCIWWYRDEDRDGYGLDGDSKCLCAMEAPYTALFGLDCDDRDEAVHPGAQEVCGNLKDDDCDGLEDTEGAAGCTIFYRDEDGDGYGQGDDSRCLCEPKGPYLTILSGDCDDTDPEKSPGRLEACNGKDDDCDGQIDEADALGCESFGYDGDGDGYFDGSKPKKCLCGAEGFYRGTLGVDCDDSDPQVNPGAPEVCGNFKDDDCDGMKDEAGAQGCKTYFKDVDGDGYGNDNKPTQCLCSPDPINDYTAEVGGDCNDFDPTVHPEAKEACNGKDDDCNGSADEGEGLVGCKWFGYDEDGDNYWNPNEAKKCLCGPQGSFRATLGPDCDDSDANINPEAKEVCNGKDDDCDGTTDEDGAVGCSTFYRDNDGDGYGVVTDFKCLCSPAKPYSATMSGDCDDADAGINPLAKEACDGKDNNCDGGIDQPECTYLNTFDGVESINDFEVIKTCDSCTATVSNGVLRMSCPDNCDIFAVLKVEIGDPSLASLAQVDMISQYWQDPGPRNGISFAAQGATYGAWGPSPGYDFLASDPYDSLQGSCCSSGDNCPSITKSNGVAILNCQEVATSPNVSYHLKVALLPSSIAFSIATSGNEVAAMGSDDTEYRRGRFGLHCSESTCEFDNFMVTVRQIEEKMADCRAVYQAYPDLPSGVYKIDPDGPGGNEPFLAHCDMAQGGFTLIGKYVSYLELQIYDYTRDQVQATNVGANVDSPPSIWRFGTFGHAAYTRFPISGRELRMDCRAGPGQGFYTVSRSDLFTDWNDGDKGAYGASSGWGVLRYKTGRNNHWVCGYIVESYPLYPGIGYCKGPGAGGSWANHQVSVSFCPSDSYYDGGTAIGCNGSGINYGKSGSWEARIWVK